MVLLKLKDVLYFNSRKIKQFLKKRLYLEKLLDTKGQELMKFMLLEDKTMVILTPLFIYIYIISITINMAKTKAIAEMKSDTEQTMKLD